MKLISRYAAVVVVLVLLAFSTGGAMARSATEPSESHGGSPPERGIAEEFAWPFRYTIQPASELVPTTISRSMYAFTEGSTETYPGFGYEAARGVHGVTVSYATRASTHGGDDRARLPLRPGQFLSDLRGNSTLAFGPTTRSVLDGLPAVEVAVVGTYGPGYPDIHITGDALVALAFPGTLLVAETEHGSLVVHVWAATAEELSAWLPLASEFVESIDFVTPSPAPLSAERSSSASEEPTPPVARHATHYRVMSPGRYLMPEPNTGGVGAWPVARVVVTVPGGWTQWGPWRGGGILKGTDTVEATARLAFGRLGSLRAGPGDCPDSEALLGQTVDDLAGKLLAIPGVEVVDLAIDSYVGKRVDFTVPGGSEGCGGLSGWSTPSGGEQWSYAWDQGWHHQLTILDIDGTRFVVDASFDLDAPPDLRGEVQDVVDSLEFE